MNQKETKDMQLIKNRINRNIKKINEIIKYDNYL
jgi:hypothetical protein